MGCRTALLQLAFLLYTENWLPVCPDESNDEIIYTVRIKGTVFRPKVFAQGIYTMKIGEPGTEQMKTVRGVNAVTDNNKTLDVKF